MRRLPSFSQWDRAMACEQSEALPHVRTSSPYAARGTALHRFMQVYVDTNRDRAAALAAIPAEYREEAARIEVSAFTFPAEVATEIAVGVDLLDGEARTLDAIDRAYPEPRTVWETHGTVDLFGRDDDGVLVVMDYKFGFAESEHADSLQLALGAWAALALTPDATRCEVAHVRLVDGIRLHPEWRPEPYTRDSLRPILARLLDFSARMRAGEPRETYNVGHHCTYCPALRMCPAQTELLFNGRFVDCDDGAAMDGHLADAYEHVTAVERVLKAAKDQLRTHALAAPIPLADGRVYGMAPGGQVRAHRPRNGGVL